MARAIDWTQYDTLKAQGLADREIARQWGIPWGTFHREKQKREGADLTSPMFRKSPPRHTRVHQPSVAGTLQYTVVHPAHTPPQYT
jgi:hypothetical protein